MKEIVRTMQATTTHSEADSLPNSICICEFF